MAADPAGRNAASGDRHRSAISAAEEGSDLCQGDRAARGRLDYAAAAADALGQQAECAGARCRDLRGRNGDRTSIAIGIGPTEIDLRRAGVVTAVGAGTDADDAAAGADRLPDDPVPRLTCGRDRRGRAGCPDLDEGPVAALSDRSEIVAAQHITAIGIEGCVDACAPAAGNALGKDAIGLKAGCRFGAGRRARADAAAIELNVDGSAEPLATGRLLPADKDFRIEPG